MERQRGRGECAKPCASAGKQPSFPPDWSRDSSSGASASPARRSAPGAGVGCSAGSRECAGRWEPEARHGAANSDNSEARGELIHRRLLLRPPPQLCAAPRAGKLAAEAPGSLPLWAAAAGIRGRGTSRRGAAPPRAAPGGALGSSGAAGLELAAIVRARARARVCVCPRARLCVPPLPGYGNPQLGLLPEAVLACPRLPSDSAAPKANGEGASFKVHVNLVLVGYSLAATDSVWKGVVPTAPSEPFSAPHALPALAQRPRRAELDEGAWV